MRRHAFLLKELVKRDFQGRYAGSLLGFLWSFVQPLWLLGLYVFVFGTVMKISLVGERTDHFGIFLFAGLLPWMAIQEGVTRGTTAVTDNSELVKKLSFPSEILVAAVVIAALLHEAIAAGLFVLVLLLMGALDPRGLPLLALAVPLQLALTFGLGLLLAPLHVFFRDTAQLFGMLLGGWFFLTPIVYPLDLVPERYRGAIELNPLTALVDLYRRALLGGKGGDVPGLLGLVLVAAVLVVAGLWLFRRLRPAFADAV
jgi:lipopolysaccharide transport system permease protein